MSFVVDASVVASWVLPDESTEASHALLRQLDQKVAVAPDLLWHETRYFIALSVRRGRVSLPEAPEVLKRAHALPIRTVTLLDRALILEKAIALGITAYDAAYLALAKSEGLPLATLDRRLRDAAEKEGVSAA